MSNSPISIRRGERSYAASQSARTYTDRPTRLEHFPRQIGPRFVAGMLVEASKSNDRRIVADSVAATLKGFRTALTTIVEFTR